MKKQFYSLFSVIALFILLISCTAENELITPIKQGLNAQDYQAALVAADTAIAREPGNGQGYYYKAYALSRIAANEPVVADRKPLLERMRENLDEAQVLFSLNPEPPAEANNVVDLTLESWSREHNAAIGYATDDSLMATVDEPLQLSIDHLVNATTVNPDSALSYDVLAQIYHMNGDYANAASSLEKAIDIRQQGDAADYDRLSSYYFLQDDYESALIVIEQGLTLYPDSITLVQKVADAYFQTGQADKALEVVEDLIQRDPQNPQYRLVVGTQIYQRVQTLTDQIAEKNDEIFELKGESGNEAKIAELESEINVLNEQANDLTVRAESALVKAAELDKNNPVTYNTLGILYQNKSAALFELRNMTSDNEQAAEYDEMARKEAEKAMNYYERAAELDPEDQGLWETLFRIYTLLDYREKAEAAMEKAGM